MDAVGQAAVSSRLVTVEGAQIHYLQAPQQTDQPVLYLHGNPTASWLWRPFLERTGGIAPDLPAFGGSRGAGDFGYTLSDYADWVAAFRRELGLERVRFVIHDIGSIIGLVHAQREPDGIERLVLMNHAPLLPGYHWHLAARLWRTPKVGEAMMRLLFTPRIVPQLVRSRRDQRAPVDFSQQVADGLTTETKKAILLLYRSMSEDDLAAAGADLRKIKAPTLVAWSDKDPYIPGRFGAEYCAALGGDCELAFYKGAGHWFWLERPEAIERVTTFVCDENS